ncbi:unnamed protein product, partial [Choristocarpus tenellus]
ERHLQEEGRGEKEIPLLLNIGGIGAERLGWQVVNIAGGEGVDHVLQMDDLKTFPDNSVTAVYASHVLEHGSHRYRNRVTSALREWHRVLKGGGALFLSVPDLETLSKLFVAAQTTMDRWEIMR